jgi:hypothetical protein
MTGQDFQQLLKSISPNTKIHPHNARSLAKQAQIAAEHGTSFWQVLVDYSKLYSFTFTMKALGLSKDTYAYCSPIFNPRLMQKQERPYMVGNRRAAKYPPIPVDCPICKNTVYWRLRNGWTWEQAIGRHSKRTSKANVANLGTKRNKVTWQSIINQECKRVKENERQRKTS